MGQIVTLKELEEKYGWGFVLFKNPVKPEGYAYVTSGEYVFHSKSKDDCWNKFDEIEEGHLGIFPFGINPKYQYTYPSVSTLSAVNEPPIEPQK